MTQIMEEKSPTIEPINTGESPYEQLLTEGINLLQDFSSAIWTDYNEHDPGLTLLENLLFALTEVMNKTDLPVQDILTQNEGMELKSGDNAFYVASDIFTINPITTNDYRKLIIDRVNNVKNVFIETLPADYAQLSGVYKFYIELYLYNPDPEKQKIENDRIRKAVRDVYLSHRNLCEDLYDITIYEPYPLEMNFIIQLAQNVNSVETILTQIIETVTNYLSPSVSFYSLQELQNMGYTSDQIFDGPKLKNGFILDSELNDRLTLVKISEIIKRISKINQIESITEFDLTPAVANLLGLNLPEENKIPIPEGFAPYLLFPSNTNKLVFQIGDIHVSADLKTVKNEINFLQSFEYSNQKNIYLDEEIGIPQGTYRNILDFPTVRNQFPIIYGIGTDNLPYQSNALRRAEAKQLQAFLLPFEQLMVNFLAQLQNLFTLFDTRNENTNSYFYTVLQDMEQVMYLIAPPNTDEGEALIFWNETLKNLNNWMDSKAISRLNQIANNLLLRFAEEIDTYSLHKIDSRNYGEEKIDSTLLTKRKLINQYDVISYTRGKSFNYVKHIYSESDLYTDDENLIGLHRKLCILLEIENYQNRSLTAVIAKSGIKMYGRKEGLDVLSEKLSPLLSDEKGEWIFNENILLIDQTVGNLENSVIFLGNEDSLLQEVLLKGVIRDNYEIRESSGERDKKFYVLFNYYGNIHPAHISHSEEEALEIIQKTIDFLIQVNKNSEGMYLVEHLLLAPSYDKAYFGFSIDLSALNPNLKVVLNHVKLDTLLDRDNNVALIQQNCYPPDSLTPNREWILLSEPHRGAYQLQVKKYTGELIAVSASDYPTSEEVESYINMMKTLDANNSNEAAFEPIMKAYYGPSVVNEAFFSFRMSFVLPDWPARFQDLQFKRLFESTVYEQAPIQVANSIYWIGMTNMQAFEKIYFRWLEQMANPTSEEELMKRKFEMLCFLQYLNATQVDFI